MDEPTSATGQVHRDQHLRGEDWYGDDLGAARFVDCTFTDVDLSAADFKRTRLDLAGAVLLAELHGADVDTAV